MEIEQLTINFFSGVFLAVFAIGLSSNFRIVKFLNLAYGSFFTLGAYVAYHFFTKFGVLSLVILLLVSSLSGASLYILMRLIGKGILEATIVSLGFGILLEELLRLCHTTGYFLILDTPIKTYTILGVEISQWEVMQLGVLMIVLLTLTLVFKSRYGIKIKFIEEDVELASMYGVNHNFYEALCICNTSILATLLGFLSSPHQAIFPSMGWSILVAGIIVFAITSQFKLVGLKHYLVLAAVSIAYAEVVGWF
ncbi:hypothetical protein DRP05_03635 [Archaeoglobales archaeon]|nr:MAG: hypothetical protein DRP05_03635 [Archaeoglobales archaeon]